VVKVGLGSKEVLGKLILRFEVEVGMVKELREITGK